MKVHVQSVNFVADGKLLDFIQKRIDKLERFSGKVMRSNMYLKVENTSAKENKIAEVILSVPGGKLVVKKQCKSFEEAIDAACGALKPRLKKRKELLKRKELVKTKKRGREKTAPKFSEIYFD